MGMLRTKWMAMVASIWIQSSCGGTYSFGIYSSVIKSTQSYDQSTLDAVSVAKDVGANVGVLAGLLYAAVTSDSSSHRRNPPWPVLAAGAVQCFVGYFLIWSAVVGLIAPPPVPLMCLFMLLAAHAQTFFNTANVVTAVENFSAYGGTAVGIMKGFIGLSGAVLIQLYETVCKGNPAAFILIVAITPTAVTLLLMPLVRVYQSSRADDKKHLNGLSVVCLAVAVYLMLLIALENTFGFPRWAHVVTFTLLAILLASPVFIAVKAHSEQKDITLPQCFPHDGTPLLGSLQSSSAADGDPADLNIDVKTPQGDRNMTLLQAMCSLNFWLLFFAMICGTGSGLATINNIRQVGESLHYSAIAINSLISLCCIWNFFGRFGAGYVSDVYLHGKGWPRPLFMAITLATMSLGHVIIALGFSGNLYLGSVVVCISYGSQWSLMPAITSELFGVRHMGTIFNTIGTASPIGSYIFSVRLIGYMYDIAAGGDNFCYGTHCFMTSFLVMAFVAFVGFLVAGGLAFRTRNFYKQVVAKRLHDHT